MGHTAARGLRERVGRWHVSNLVSVHGGFEAAVWSNRAASRVIDFWRWNQTTRSWHRLAQSAFQVVYPDERDCIPTVLGGDVAGAADAVFIVRSLCFSGDGSSNVEAFAHGTGGWGVLRSGPSRMTVEVIKPGRGDLAYEGARYDMRFRHGLLLTIDGNDFLGRPPSAFPYLTYWRASHGAFVDAHDNTFLGVTSTGPDRSTPALSSGPCPEEGTYAASFGIDGDHGSGRVFARLRLLMFPKAKGFPQSPGCVQWISATLPVTVQVARANTDDGEDVTSLSKRQWVTAPAWILVSGEYGVGGPVSFYEALGHGHSPWALPGIDANVLMSDMHDVPYKLFRRFAGRAARPAWGTVTFVHGKLVTLAVASTLSLTPAP